MSADEGGIAGFDAAGKLVAMSWIDTARGLTEQAARNFCRKGGLKTRKVSTPEMRALMVEHGWVKPEKRRPAKATGAA